MRESVLEGFCLGKMKQGHVRSERREGLGENSGKIPRKCTANARSCFVIISAFIVVFQKAACVIFFLSPATLACQAQVLKSMFERSTGSDCICRRLCIMSGCGIEAGEGGKWSPE